MEAANRLSPRHTWITHITHNMSHQDIKEFLNSKINNYSSLLSIKQKGGSVEPAYDGLILEI